MRRIKLKHVKSNKNAKKKKKKDKKSLLFDLVLLQVDFSVFIFLSGLTSMDLFSSTFDVLVFSDFALVSRGWYCFCRMFFSSRSVISSLMVLFFNVVITFFSFFTSSSC